MGGEPQAPARSYYERALAIRETVLGPEHPDTATSRNNLGILCCYEGEREAAALLHRAVERAVNAAYEAFLERQISP